VVLVDGDPISRQVLGGTLRAGAGISLLGSVDSRMPVGDWPVTRLDLAILVAGPRENHVLMAQELAAIGTRALMIGMDWTKPRIDAALSSGAAGCLSKDWALHNLCTAAQAAASGYVVLSPDLVDLCVSTGAMVGGRFLENRLGGLTQREREVLTLLAEGLSTTEVSQTLVVSPATVKSHVSHSLTKLGVRNRLEAVLLMQAAMGCGLDGVDNAVPSRNSYTWQSEDI
jgi:DNA-binding NarL/FixJ family response regulator